MKPADLIARLRLSRDGNGVARLGSKETAVLIRARLKSAFPGVKFSVRSDYNSVDVYWTDGPCGAAVDAIIRCYSFGGFDGMIDLAYDADNWLLPDGSMAPAASRGTTGSMGTCDAYATDCPVPGAFLVSGGPRYVFSHRTETEAHRHKWLALVHARYGDQIDRSLQTHLQRACGEYVDTLARRMEREAWEAEQRRSAKPRVRLYPVAE